MKFEIVYHWSPTSLRETIFVLVCDDCRETMTGAAFVRSLLKKKAMIICPCCQGKGIVKP